MFKHALAAAAMVLTVGTPALAQMSPMQAGPPQRGSMNAGPGSDGMTADQLNGHVARQVERRDDARAQARRDRMAYRAALMRRYHLSVERYNMRYARREAAYAEAMSVWRDQVYACHHGHERACRAPTPRVADFY